MHRGIPIFVIAVLASCLLIGTSVQGSLAQQATKVIPITGSNTSELDSKSLTLPEIFNRTENSVVQITSTSPTSEQIPNDEVALGSGFVYDQEGHIITNYHVIADPNNVEVTFVDGDSYPAKVVGEDPYSDIVVLQITDEDFQKRIPPLKPANSSTLEVGEQVIAIGNPFGLSGTLTTGVVSQIGRVLPNDVTGYSVANLIQTDAAINPGNSGGPLLNSNGEMVGMNTAIFSNTGVYSGVGFAIPSNMVQKVVSSLLNNGTYEHPYLGITGITLSPKILNASKLDDKKGILVVDITADSPADKAGIRGGDVLTNVDGQDIRLGGDIIVAVDNQSVRAMEDLLSYLEEQKVVGDNLELSIIRDGRIQHMDFVLAARPNQGFDDDSPQSIQGQGQGQEERPALGINGINLTPELAGRMNISQSQKGFLVEDIISGGPADLAGIRGGYKVTNINGSDVNLGGDIIVRLDQTEVNSIQDILSYLDTKKIGDRVQVHVIRDGQGATIPLTLGKLQSEEQALPGPTPFEDLSPQSPFSQEPFGGNIFGDMYNRCVESVGKDICDRMFGR